jgi:AcrR family transcriptional regulator
MRTQLLSRIEKKAATSRRLIEAGRKLFLRRGFHGATLEDIGLECGVTKGAVYSNFADKNDLFLAILDARIEQRSATFADFATSAKRPEDLYRMQARLILQNSRIEARWTALTAEVWSHAAGNERLRAALRERHERLLQILSSGIERIAAAAGFEFEVSSNDLARFGGAFIRGLLLERLLDPKCMSDQSLEAAFAALFRGLTRNSSPAKAE